MRANEFLYETIEIVSERTSSDELIDVLSKAGYEVKKVTGRTVKVLVPSRQRGSKAQEIVKILSARPIPPLDNTVHATSDEDEVKYDGATIKVKPVERQDSTVKESGQIGELESEIKKHLGDKPFINLVFGEKIVQASGIRKVEKTPKADAEIIDPEGNPVAWISLKDGSTPKSFGQWSGASKFSKYPDVIKFVNDLKAFLPTNVMPNEVTYGMEITDPVLKAKACFGEDYVDVPGGPFGINNIDLVLQGKTLTIKKGSEDTYFLSGAHTWLNGNTPSGEYDPVLTARFDKDRNDFGIRRCRITMFSTKGRNWKPIPTPPAPTPQLSPEVPQQELDSAQQLDPAQQELDPTQQALDPAQQPAKKKQRLGYSRQGEEPQPVSEDLLSILKNAGIR
jgi:hypothetical protein